MKWFRSLRWQLQSWHTILLTLIVGGMLVAFYRYEREVETRLLDAELWEPIHRVLPAMQVRPVIPKAGLKQPPEFGEEKRARILRAAANFSVEEARDSWAVRSVESQGLYIATWIGGRQVYVSEHAPANVPQPSEDQPTLGKGKEDKSRHEVRARWNGGNREVIQPTPTGYVIVGASADKIEARMAVFRNKLIGFGVGVLLIGVLGGRWIARKALSPIAAMSEAALKIAHGDLSKRIDETKVQNELGDLAGVLNSSFEQLEHSIQQQVRFTADASHEMRTPLAVILAKTELALMRERSAEKYRETIKACYDSACHMQTLIESLLELSKVDSGQLRVEMEVLDIDQLVAESVSLIEPLTEQRSITMTADLEAASVVGDAQRLKQVVINLLSNAVKYNREGGSIAVRVSVKSEQAILEVRDTGPGISADDLPCIFDRFYKVDDSRESEKGSTGLGLSISKAIVVAHHGTIHASSVVGEGTCFTITLPALNC